MKIENAFQEKDEMEARRDLANTNDWPSNFKFLNSYNGWRAGFAHLFIGNTHVGKSTFVRSLLIDAAIQENAKILLYLSEESAADFKTEIAFVGKEIEALKKITIYSEQDNAPDQKTVNVMQELVERIDPNLVFFDNLTTCNEYNISNPSQQANMTQKLKRFFTSKGIPWVIFAHTAKGATQPRKLVEAEDIRGNSTLANEAQFCAGINKIEDMDGTITSVLRLLKHRGQSVHDKIYTMNYNSRTRLYHGDTKCHAETVREWLKK